MKIKCCRVSAAVMILMIIYSLTMKTIDAPVFAQANDTNDAVELVMSMTLEELLNVEVIVSVKKPRKIPEIPEINNQWSLPVLDFTSSTFSLALARAGWVKKWPGIFFPPEKNLKK